VEDARWPEKGREGRVCSLEAVKTGRCGVELRCPADVVMMQATDFRNLHDPARLGELNGPGVRRILVERQMRASPVIVREVAAQGAAQVPFAEDENVIQYTRVGSSR